MIAITAIGSLSLGAILGLFIAALLIAGRDDND